MTAGAGESLGPVAPAGPCADLAEDPEGNSGSQSQGTLIERRSNLVQTSTDVAGSKRLLLIKAKRAEHDE
jgi:hypothetical protein